MARPTKYDPETSPLLARYYAREGMVDEQIAAKMKIGVSTLNEWKNRYPAFKEAIKEGKDVPDAQVENTLLKRALGYEFTELSIEKSADGKTIRQKATVRHFPGNPVAIIFWLKNRRPDKWRDIIKELENVKAGGEQYLQALMGLAAKVWQDEEVVDDGSTDDSLPIPIVQS